MRDASEQLWLMSLDPQQPRGRRDRHPVAATIEDLAGAPRGHQLRRLRGCARVDVGARPQLVARIVVEHRALAHAGAAHRPDRGGLDRGACHRLPDALAEQRPVARRVEYLRAGHAGLGRMGPLPLSDRDLFPGVVEDDRATAAGAQVEGEQQAHRDIPRTASTSGLARLRRGRPSAMRAISRAIISPPRLSVSEVAPAMCATMITLGYASNG
jgi:hypothetical protein